MKPSPTLFVALLSFALFSPGAAGVRAQLPPAAPTAETRITEVVVNVDSELPQGYIMEPGQPILGRLYKVTEDPAKPVAIWSSASLKEVKSDGKAPTGVVRVSFSAGGFVLAPADKVRIQIQAPVLSKTRDEAMLAEGVSRDLALKAGGLSRVIMEDQKLRLTAPPAKPAAPVAGAPAGAAPQASPSAPGVTVRVVAKLPQGLKPVNKAPMRVRILDATQAGAGKEPPELATAEAPAAASAELGGVYTRIRFPSLTLTPGQRLSVSASLSVEEPEDKGKKKAAKTVLAEGKSPQIVVRPGDSDLGVVRLTLRD